MNDNPVFSKLLISSPKDYVFELFLSLQEFHEGGYLLLFHYWALIQWPINLQMSFLFITRKLTVFRPELILASFAVMTTIGMLGEFAPFPFSLLGLVTGCTTLPPMAISLFIGSSLGNIILRKLGGDEWWNNYRSVIVAGLGAGQGIIIGISTALALVGRSKWVLPY